MNKNAFVTLLKSLGQEKAVNSGTEIQPTCTRTLTPIQPTSGRQRTSAGVHECRSARLHENVTLTGEMTNCC